VQSSTRWPFPSIAHRHQQKHPKQGELSRPLRRHLTRPHHHRPDTVPLTGNHHLNSKAVPLLDLTSISPLFSSLTHRLHEPTIKFSNFIHSRIYISRLSRLAPSTVFVNFIITPIPLTALHSPADTGRPWLLLLKQYPLDSNLSQPHQTNI